MGGARGGERERKKERKKKGRGGRGEGYTSKNRLSPYVCKDLKFLSGLGCRSWPHNQSAYLRPVVCPARELGHRSPGADFEDQDQDCGLAIIGFQTRKRSACDDVLLFWCRGQLIHWAAENAQYTLLGGPHPADGLPRL